MKDTSGSEEKAEGFLEIGDCWTALYPREADNADEGP
jgi:hypothetical protein